MTKPSVVGPDGRKAKTASAPESLDPLHDRAEIVGRQRHADRLDDLPAGLLEGRLEGVLGIDARAVIADAVMTFLMPRQRDLADRRRGLPVVKEVRTTSGLLVTIAEVAALMITSGTLRLLRGAASRHGIGREIEAGEILHLVLDDQFLRERLGLRRVGCRQVAVDHLDVVALRRSCR